MELIGCRPFRLSVPHLSGTRANHGKFGFAMLSLDAK
jgi:hypothetical protein